MSNRFFVTLLLVIALLGGIFFATKHKNNPPTSSSSSEPTAHLEGSTESGVVLVEYGDYQCPACGQYYPIVKQVFEKYKGQITFQFRNFPLVQLHQNAFAGARAAEAADNQGKFWEMHDLLYENQQTWGSASNPSSFFLAYAKQLGLNIDQFQTDMASQATNDKINADIEQAQKLGASATPTFVLDGKKLDQNPTSLDSFNKLIEDTIAAKQKQ
jgi:protein-disulfide isomerase